MEHEESTTDVGDVKSSSDRATNASGQSYDEQLLKRCKNVHFDVEAWYPILQSETFYTQFIPISPSIAQAFVHFYQTRYMSRKVLTANDIQLIQTIQQQLKEQIFHLNTNISSDSGTFIRLSARSPKDGIALDSRKMSQFYSKKLSELQIAYPNEYQSVKGKANMQVIAFYYAQFHSMKVTDEIQALNMILTSERVYYDLVEVLDCQQVKENQMANVNRIEVFEWNNHIIVRQWHDLLDPSMEFRCFVHQSQLTAISQYNYYCKYYHLQNDEFIQQIKTTIRNYWHDTIQPLLSAFPDKYSNYTIDIGLMKNTSTNGYDCVVIEMNPFERTTNPSLFDWTKDANQLKGQGDDVEIRVQRDYYPYIEDYIEFLLEVNDCNGQNQSLSDHPGRQPYFVFLDQMRTQLSA